MTTHVFTCADCKVTKSHTSGITTGYGVEPGTDAKICFECCGKRTLAAALETGKATLYLSFDRLDSYGPSGHGTVSDWPGALKATAYIRRGRHNMARYRFDVWFRLPGDDFMWHGVTYGDNTQICHCKRTKAKR